MEQVSWFAMNKQTMGKRFIATQDRVTHVPVELAFESQNNGKPSFFAAMQTYNGPNTATLRNTQITQFMAKIFVEEEKSKDDEVRHVPETVGIMALWEDY